MPEYPNFFHQEGARWGNTLSAAQETRWGHTLSTAQQLVRWGADPANSRALEATFSYKVSEFAKKALHEIAAHVEVFHSLRLFSFVFP